MEVGASVGNYKLIEKLGEGTFGVAFKCQHRVFANRYVVLKALRPELAAFPEIVSRFRDEGKAAAALNHPNIVGVIDVGETDSGEHYLLMEYCHGQDCRSAIEQVSRMGVDRAVDIIVQACSGLSAAHAIGIIHRDLKPDNLFLAASNHGSELVKVLDFGVAKLLDSSKTKSTVMGVQIGTPLYMSPEQASGLRSIDQRSDVYALGVILYELLSGATPFEGSQQWLLDVLAKNPEPLDTRVAGLPAGLSTAVSRAMEKRPEDRFSSAEEFSKALSSCMAQRNSKPRVQTGSDSATASSALEDPAPPTVWRLDGASVAQLGIGHKLTIEPVAQPEIRRAGDAHRGSDAARAKAPGAAFTTLQTLKPVEAPATTDLPSGESDVDSKRGRSTRWLMVGAPIVGLGTVVALAFTSQTHPSPSSSSDGPSVVEKPAPSAAQSPEASSAKKATIQQVSDFDDMLAELDEESAKKATIQPTAHKSPCLKCDLTTKGQVELVELPDGPSVVEEPVPSAAQSPAVSSTKKVIKQATAHESPGIKRDFTAKGQVELVELPEGTFRMGSPNDEGFLYERPQHEVTVSSFWMGRYEVTHGQYRLYLQANPKAPKPYERMDSGPADKPVIGVSWDDANAFARWAGARLPTEAEWEYACRAGTEESRYGELDAIAWYDKNSKNQAHPVGMKQPNAWGLHDMLGNVWEWCSDWHGPYHPVPVTDPSGPTMGSERVFRGGAWGSGARRARAAGRERYVPGDRGVSLGFRLARGQPPASK